MKTIEDSYVAFLDILGFKDLVDKNSHLDLQTIFSNDIMHNINRTKKMMDDVNSELGMPSAIQVLSVSDSIIMWTEGTSPVQFVNIVNAAFSALLFFMQRGAPLRGAISKGPVSVHESENQKNIFGKGITNAYNLENIQQWSGAVIDEICLTKEIIASSEYEILRRKHILVEYLVPFKTGPVEYRHAINWAGLDGKVFYGDYEAIEKQFARHNKSIDDWSVKQKIDHTAAFARFVQTLPKDGITG
ncbi:hypothetical protein [Paenibacillus sp. GbtcB18]|uniref:hypothetical protein n=1 Tax=Paenibacillus sp. GbtcB18 TaxID=2824763 RepID=UPI001C2F8E01|nr:hypothetical protein [Paenibacillus sp. GbtcB18]